MTLLKLLGLRLLAIKHLGYLADEPDIEGRDIQFTTQGSLGEYDIDRLKKIIYLVSNVEKAAKEFPLIIFHFFEDEKLNYMAAVDPSKYKGITINCAKADKMSDIEIYETIVHELIHLLQLKKARIIQKSKRASLYLEIKAKERQKEFGTPNFFLSLEKSIHHFYNFISVEALASYYSKLAARKIKFSERELKSNYSKAKKVCQYFNYLWEKFIAEEDHKKIPILAKKFTSNLVSDDNLNFHLMYTVVFTEHLEDNKIDDFYNVKPFIFLKRYEKAIKSKGYKPLVSNTDEDSLLCYKKMRNQLKIMQGKFAKK